MPANSAQFSKSLPLSGTLQIPPMWTCPSSHPLQQAMVQTNTWDRIVATAAQDEECRFLCRVISNRFPTTKEELPELIRNFWQMKDNLNVMQGVILKGHKILIPCNLRAEVLECLHATHQGVNRMSANARQRLFWPGIDANLRQTQVQCRACNTVALFQPKEPMSDPPTSQFPFQQTVTNLCDITGNKYVIYAD